MDISNKIPDTSLFAELVKDKHKRDKVLKEIIDKQEETKQEVVISSGESTNSAITNNNNLVVIDTVDGDASGGASAKATPSSFNDAQTSNGVKDALRLVDIPMPIADDSQTDKSTSNQLNAGSGSEAVTMAANSISNLINVNAPPVSAFASWLGTLRMRTN